MRWFNVTCSSTEHIIPVQQWLFEKYVGIEPVYLNVKDTPINNWGKKVASMLPDDKYIIFGLDDYLPIDYLNEYLLTLAMLVIKNKDLERFELGWGASKKQGFEVLDDVLFYGEATPYKVSCQFSIWDTSALKRVLNSCTTPWDFEVNGYCKAACFKEPVLRWIEESALSKRQSGKINVLGLKPSDVKELQDLKLLGKNIIYGWKGETEIPLNKGGNKYEFNYD
jgi:hypothetical protein